MQLTRWSLVVLESSIGSSGQRVNCITHRTTANGQLTFGDLLFPVISGRKDLRELEGSCRPGMKPDRIANRFLKGGLTMKIRFLVAAAFALLWVGSQVAFAQQNPAPAANMSFFVTSSNPKGGNLGGLTGADAVCQALARAVGSTKTWH